MATIRRFEDLECWQEARKLVNLIYSFTKKKGFNRDIELKGQIRRSAISVMANIAEGFHRRGKKEFMRFLDYSRSSIAETLSHCFVALDENYVGDSEMNEAKKQSEVVWKKVNSLITYLNKSTARK
jgi:four helix bundle protein